MQRSCLSEEVIYSSNIFAEIEFAKLVLAYLKLDYKGGISSNGYTIHLTHKANTLFEKEVRQWKDAAVEVCCAFSK